jgi:hypothetical protein
VVSLCWLCFPVCLPRALKGRHTEAWLAQGLGAGDRSLPAVRTCVCVWCLCVGCASLCACPVRWKGGIQRRGWHRGWVRVTGHCQLSARVCVVSLCRLCFPVCLPRALKGRHTEAWLAQGLGAGDRSLPAVRTCVWGVSVSAVLPCVLAPCAERAAYRGVAGTGVGCG